MSQKVWPLLLLAITCLLISCKESALNPTDAEVRLTALEITPASVQFTPADGIRDTLVWFEYSVQVLADDLSQLETGFTVRENGELLSFKAFAPGEAVVSGQTLQGRFSVSARTIENRSPLLNVYAFDPSGRGEVLTRGVEVRGFATSPPELLEVRNPAEITLPSTGSKTIRFEAVAAHPVDQGLMDGVFIWLVDSAQERIPSDGSTFRLYDDGVEEASSGRDDAVAGDSLYTLVLSIGSQNSPDDYTVNWVARDQSGLASDTLTSTLRILPAP